MPMIITGHPRVGRSFAAVAAEIRARPTAEGTRPGYKVPAPSAVAIAEGIEAERAACIDLARVIAWNGGSAADVLQAILARPGVTR